jgi:tRNA(His) 5'-end guanylyltransferase
MLTADPGDRFKDAERSARTHLNPKSYGILRLDGRAFHTYCRGLERPADTVFMGHMDEVAATLVRELTGARLAYVQSDELSVVFSTWRDPEDGERKANTQQMFGGQIQKLVSISAALASTTMNVLRLGSHTDRIALFDARAFSLPTWDDTVDYLAWRQHDARKNSVSMAASSVFTSRELHGVNTEGRLEMLKARGIAEDATPLGFRRGRVVVREQVPDTTTFVHGRTQQTMTVDYLRTVTVARPAPLFMEDGSLVPRQAAEVAPRS